MNIFVIWHDHDGHRRGGYPQKMTKETKSAFREDPSREFQIDWKYGADCIREAIDKEILEEIKKAAEEDDQRSQIHS